MKIKEVFDWLFFFRFIFVFCTYFLSAQLGLQFDAVGGLATLIWPPAGIAIASVFLFGYSYIFAVFFAAWLANMFNGASFTAGFFIGLGNIFATILGVQLLRMIFKFNPGFIRLRDAIALIVVSVTAPVLSASIGALTLLTSSVIHRDLVQQTLMTWWVGDALGILIIAPIVFSWSSDWKTFFKVINLKTLVEGLLPFTVLILICLMSFGGLFGVDARRIPITQLLYPTLIWICLRLNPKLSITAVFFVAVISVWGTYNKYGPFVRASLDESLLYLLIFIASIGVTFIILAAVMEERKKLHSLKDEFISAASHELKTPVTTIKAYVQLIAKQFKNKELKRKENFAVQIYIARVEEQIERLVKLIYELLDVSRIESGKLELEYSKFKVSNLIGEMVRDFKRTTSSHNVVYRNRQDFFINADRYRISQVLINLISNAIKFSPQGKKVIISAIMNKRWVLFSIQDFGLGIDQKFQTDIFERFFQTENKQLSSSGGLGLGLYLSSEIVKKHGGRIWVESEFGNGSTFFFTLPINRI